MEYHSAEIRRLARQIASAASSIQALSAHDLTGIRQSVEAELKGQAATMLVQALKSQGDTYSKLASDFHSLANDLMEYAARLDAADQEAQKFINQK